MNFLLTFLIDRKDIYTEKKGILIFFSSLALSPQNILFEHGYKYPCFSMKNHSFYESNNNPFPFSISVSSRRFNCSTTQYNKIRVGFVLIVSFLFSNYLIRWIEGCK